MLCWRAAQTVPWNRLRHYSNIPFSESSPFHFLACNLCGPELFSSFSNHLTGNIRGFHYFHTPRSSPLACSPKEPRDSHPPSPPESCSSVPQFPKPQLLPSPFGLPFGLSSGPCPLYVKREYEDWPNLSNSFCLLHGITASQKRTGWRAATITAVLSFC